MARGRGGRGPSRLDKRRENEAAEAREKDEEEVDDEASDEDEDEEEEADEEADAEADVDADVEADIDADADADVDDDGDADDDEDAPKKKKKKVKKVAVKKEAKPKAKRTKAVKVVRRRAVWQVIENNGKIAGTFPFHEKAEAEALMQAKILEKEGKTTFYIQLYKEEMGE
jgi:hypothetical protein